MSEVLIESMCPNGNLMADVVAEHGTCYFYIRATEEESDFGMRAVWVRNLKAAPSSWGVASMKRGQPPLNDAAHCRSPKPQPKPQSNELSIVWLPEGNGAALYENDEILAIIPPWSGFQDFPGYARDAVGEGMVAWELNADNVLHDRFQQAKLFWGLWDEGNPWPKIQQSLCKSIERSYGKETNYYAIDGGAWPPKALLRIAREEFTILISVGVSVRPMPNVEMSTDTPQLFRRIEIGAVLPNTWSDDAIKRFASYLSAQSNYPWDRLTWLGNKHTFPCVSWQNANFTSALLLDKHEAIPSVVFDPQFGDPVTTLWFIPITEKEAALAQNKGPDALMKSLPTNRWQEA